MDPILCRIAESEGWLAQSNHLLHNVVTTSQYLEIEVAVSAIEHTNGGSTMTAEYGNLSTDQAAVQRSQNTRIHDLPSSDERRGIGMSSRENLGPSRRPPEYLPFWFMDTPDCLKRKRKTKIGRVTTLATRKMIDSTHPCQNPSGTRHSSCMTGWRWETPHSSARLSISCQLCRALRISWKPA